MIKIMSQPWNLPMGQNWIIAQKLFNQTQKNLTLGQITYTHTHTQILDTRLG